MHVLIVFSHPGKKSYTFQILERLKTEILNKNWSVEVSDLYALNFQSDLTEQEYEREKSSNVDWPVSNDVRQEQMKISRADCIIFLYPVWWSDCPAKLKGWFDRVFTVGFAYKKESQTSGMKTIPFGVAMCTAGYTEEMLRELGIAQSMETIMLSDRFGNRFLNKQMIILGGTLSLETVEPLHQRRINELMEKMSAMF